MRELSVRKRIRQYKWHLAQLRYNQDLDEVVKWCSKSIIKGQWTFSRTTSKFAFKNEDDLLMFTLRWS